MAEFLLRSSQLLSVHATGILMINMEQLLFGTKKEREGITNGMQFTVQKYISAFFLSARKGEM
jgi:hypothetical protein